MALEQLCARAGSRTISEFAEASDTAACDLFARFQRSRTNDEDVREPPTRRDEEKMESSGEDEDTEVAAAFDQPPSPRSEPGAVCPPPLKRKGSNSKKPRKRAKTPTLEGLSEGLSAVAVSPARVARVSPRGSPRGGSLGGDDDQGDLLVRIRDSAEKMKQALTCKACGDWFNEPISLRCGHAMCRACAQEQTKCLKRGAERTSQGLQNSARRPSPSRHMTRLTLFDVAGAASQSSAAMRRGCVMTMFVSAARPLRTASSRMNCGTWARSIDAQNP